jgi:hypothetical protein
MLPWIIAGIILYLSLAYACGRYTAKIRDTEGAALKPFGSSWAPCFTPSLSYRGPVPH